MTTIPIRVMIADDHPVVLDGLQTQLMRDVRINVVGTARSFAEVSRLLAHVAVDVLILDILNMGGSPLAMVSGLQLSYPQVKVIVFSSSVDFAHDLLEAGACGYLTKEEMPDDLLQAILMVHAAGVFRSKNVQDYLEQTACGEFTPKEMLLLKLNAQGLSSDEIRGHVLLGQGTVDNYFLRLKRKTGCTNRTQLAVWYRDRYGDPG